MEHLAAVLKPLAPEKTVGGEACLAAMKRTRNPGYALRWRADSGGYAGAPDFTSL